MNRRPGGPVRILFQEVRAATILKAQTESAEADTGGGARDLRLSPYPQFQTLHGTYADQNPSGSGEEKLSFVWVRPLGAMERSLVKSPSGLLQAYEAERRAHCDH